MAVGGNLTTHISHESPPRRVPLVYPGDILLGCRHSRRDLLVCHDGARLADYRW